ncbi:MAG TPA: hypothetical protein VFP39_00970 [Gemmatimonadales bacterium]|nr:hypothetical protein [Gemmatimonadales bacterium]
MSDRAVQDAVIRALADAPFRASSEWRQRELANEDRLDRFAKFLARHYYYERLVHFFRYSKALARVTGRVPETVLTGLGFERLLPRMVLGSRDSALAVAELVTTYLEAGGTAVPYHDDLLQYQRAMMVVESGARVWHDGSSAPAPAHRISRPTKVEGTMLLDLKHDLPAVLPQLLRDWTEVPYAPAQPTMLLIARSAHGRVSVARSTATIATVLELADGRKTLEDLAREAGLRPADLEATLEGLVDIGAVRFSTGS